MSDLCGDDPGEREADPEEPECGEDTEGAEGLGVARVRRQRVADGDVPARVGQRSWHSVLEVDAADVQMYKAKNIPNYLSVINLYKIYFIYEQFIRIFDKVRSLIPHLQ